MEKRALDASILGFGCMRFPKKGGSVNMEEAEREVLYALEHGVNYFDTAYIYKGNEKALGAILAKNGVRERVQIATKLPHYMISSIETLEKLFCEQLAHLQTDYIDNYIMHMLPDVEIWNKLCRMGIEDWIVKKKEEGRIRRIGFSYHGNSENCIKLLDAYDWEFCQVQYNYMDENSQAGRASVEHAAKKGIPIIIMEPLRGGRLVNDLPEKARAVFENREPKRSAAEWAFRWLWNQPAVSVVLSGMNSMEMLEENIRIAESVKTGELTAEDEQMYEAVKAAINEKIKVPCTGCGYCQPCPKGVDIPGAFRCYNVRYTDGYATAMREYLMCTTFRAEPTNAANCVKCGKCEQHCPQNIPIRDSLDEVKKHLETPIYKVIAFFSRIIFKQ